MHSENKGNKLYDHIAHDIREMISNKNGINGGYVMPKLINLNVDQERRVTEHHSPNLLPHRKPNPNIYLYAGQNE